MEVKKAKRIPVKKIYLTVAGTGLQEYDGDYLWHVPAHKATVCASGKAPMTPRFVNEAMDRIVIEQHWTGNWQILKRPTPISSGHNERDGDTGAHYLCGISGTMPPVGGWEVVAPNSPDLGAALTITYQSAEIQAKMASQYQRATQLALDAKADAAARKHNVGLDNLKDSFSLLDTNNDGLISREELTKVLCTLGPVPLDKGEAAELFLLADTNGDGVIDHEELAKLLSSDMSNDRGWSARVMYQEQEAARVARARAVNQAHGHAWVKGSRSGEWEFKETKKTVLPSISNNRPRVSHRLGNKRNKKAKEQARLPPI